MSQEAIEQEPGRAEPINPSRPEATDPQRYELWRPVIRAERRRALECLHHELAAEWSRAVLERGASPVVFEGLGFKEFGRLGEAGATAQVPLFAIDGTSAAGAIALSSDLARYLVQARLGSPLSAQTAGTEPAFSRLEATILRQVLDELAGYMGEAYARAGIGRLRPIRVCEKLEEVHLFALDESLIVLRFRIGKPDSSLRLSIAANLALIELVKEPGAVPRAAQASRKVARIARYIPIEARAVLGLWRVPLREITDLKPGDSIVLPDGSDAWLEAEGRRLASVKITIDGRRLTISLRRGGDHGNR